MEGLAGDGGDSKGWRGRQVMNGDGGDSRETEGT